MPSQLSAKVEFDLGLSLAKYRKKYKNELNKKSQPGITWKETNPQAKARTGTELTNKLCIIRFPNFLSTGRQD